MIKCKDCKWWEERKEMHTGYGFCHRYPYKTYIKSIEKGPSGQKTNYETALPRAPGNGWCGEAELKEKT